MKRLQRIWCRLMHRRYHRYARMMMMGVVLHEGRLCIKCNDPREVEAEWRYEIRQAFERCAERDRANREWFERAIR